MQTARPGLNILGKRNEKNSKPVEAEAGFAAEVYRDRVAVNKRAQSVLSEGSRQVTIRLDNRELDLARTQAEARGLKYQTYIKMLLHQALTANSVAP